MFQNMIIKSNKLFFILLAILLVLILIIVIYPVKNKSQFQLEKILDDAWSKKIYNTQKFFNLTQINLNVYMRLMSIQKSCGETCRTDIIGTAGKYYDLIRKKVDCENLFKNPNIDAYTEYEKAPQEIPTYLLPEFTHGGKWRILADYRDESHGKNQSIHWTKEVVEENIKSFLDGKMQGGYGSESVQMIGHHVKTYGDVKGKRGLVIGSQSPWLEGILFGLGASHLTTFDYINITSGHPQLEAMTPKGLIKKYESGERFDFMATFSSLEHSGLARYGDMLNPWGDLIAMARAWCLVKPGGYGMVGVPYGPDILGFNSHRVYGPLGLSQLFANWEVVFTEAEKNYPRTSNCYYCYQPPHSLRRL